MKVDPRIYDAPEFQAVVSTGTEQQPEPYSPPEPVSQGEVLEGTLGQALGAAENRAASREKANAIVSLGAAMSEWSPRHAYDFFAGPTFEPDPDFSVGSELPHLRMTLNETERNFLLQSKSSDEFNYRIEAVERQRFAGQTMSDNPFTSFVGAMMDPGYLAIDLVSAGAGHAAKLASMGIGAQRAVTAVTAGAGAAVLGTVEQQTVPISDSEVVVGALLNGAAAGTFYSKGSMHRVDPEYPAAELTQIAQRAEVDPAVIRSPHGFATGEGSTRTAQELVDHLELRVQGTEYAPVLAAIRRMGQLDDIQVQVGLEKFVDKPNARGLAFSTVGQDGVRRTAGIAIRPDAPTSTALHELVHATLQRGVERDPIIKGKFDRVYANVMRELSTETDPKFVQLHKKMSNLGEFLAHSSTTPEFREWAQAKRLSAAGKSQSVWDSFVETVAEVLQSPVKAVRRILSGESKLSANIQGLLDEASEQDIGTFTKQVPGLFSTGVVSDVAADADPVDIARKLDKAETKAGITGKRISWSLHKSLSSFSPESKRIADLLVDNPLDMGGDSVVSQTRAIRADLSQFQFQYEQLLTAELARRGAGLFKRITSPRKSLAIQETLEKEIAVELLTRERNSRLGIKTNSRATPEVAQMADQLDKLYKNALDGMKAAGVTGAEEVGESSGYFSRKWDITRIEDAQQRLINNGWDEASAQKQIRKLVEQGIRRANGWDADVSKSVAKAILDRAKRKGYFEDSAFRAHAGNEAAKEIRDMLKGSLNPQETQRVLDVLTGVVDEAGKLSSLKHRIDIDMKAGISLPDGTTLTVADFINTDITRMTEAYLDQAAGRIAMARKGVPDVSDIDKLRTSMLESIPDQSKRQEAVYLFDNTVNSILGRPVGEDIPAMLRNMQAVTRMVGLASSGLWQVTEYSTAMARFGALKTLRYAMKESNFANLRASVRGNRAASEELVDVLTRNSAADIRMRPYVNRLEDNFDMPTSAVAQAALLQAQQLVPYINGQKLIQTHQARVVANLVTDTLVRAGKGDQKMINMLEQYGLESRIVNKYSQVLREGTDTSKWSDEMWADLRGPLQKMMDDAVLRNRTGEIPAFAQFSQVGKFIFTFRSFVLGAHNKVLAGTLSRDGFAGLSLLMLYQFPLVLLATEANATIQGKTIKDEKELVSKAFGQMGSLGLFSELFGVITGEKQQFGAPGLIAIDRLYKLVGDAASLDAGQAASGAIQATPVLSIIPGVRAIGEALKE